jgi:dTDP-4-amino-4,6-dideoxygalactose transaminase
MNVPFFRYPHVFSQQHDELAAALERVATSGAYIMQKDLRDFEERLADYTGAVDAVGVGNATDALEMIVADAGLGPGDEVILASHTFVATASALVVNRVTPVFAEIGEDHLLDPDDVAARIGPNTRGIMVTQLNGRVANMDRFKDLAETHGLVLLEDSAQGIGALYKGRMAGTFASGGVLSFYPAKVLGALGDGGAILTMDEDAGHRFRELRDHGRDPHTGEVMRWGRNSRLDNLHAAILAVKLGAVDEEIARRRELGARYHQNLCELPGVLLPPPPETDGAHFDTFQNYEIEVEERDGLRAHLSGQGVGTILQWGGKGVHQFAALGVEASLPRTERMFARSLLLPMNTSLTLDEVDYVSEQIHAFAAATSRQA